MDKNAHTNCLAYRFLPDLGPVARRSRFAKTLRGKAGIVSPRITRITRIRRGRARPQPPPRGQGSPQGAVLTKGNEDNEGFELRQNGTLRFLGYLLFFSFPLSVSSAESVVPTTLLHFPHNEPPNFTEYLSERPEMTPHDENSKKAGIMKASYVCENEKQNQWLHSSQ
jgi:hypothetical protein